MKRITLVLTLLFFTTLGAFAQIEDPITWATVAKKTSATEATVYIKATIDDGWHLYSQTVKPGGPSKTVITFAPSKDFTLVGGTIEPKPINKFEKVFNMNVPYFEDQVVFQQKIKLKKGATSVKAKVDFMVCNDKQCLPPSEIEFTIPVK
ncbi:protein-disulfide reductase DsbD N-terminal domain-containing protein [Pedobacter insulae]|uniref:Disulphide bond corrector protein DsbC n=1 Tax=Pedobacter insulae TaxID=414048 RepID=A0A1I2X8B0_9SPHI|nr:protein-disulfide reductase DsbD N-terminal domain-containing protein [Pedobacter insulae]SFH09735.1 Disulphide bond corrector protein DsbC [Pedobacter insulae]